MKREGVNYFLVGLAVLAAGILLLLTALGLNRAGAGGVDRYQVRYANVAGLGYGSAVFYQGYRVGQVEAITPTQQAGKTQFLVDVSVRKGWQIPKDSVAALLSSGLLSDVFVGISEGIAKDVHAPGAELQAREGGDVFAAVGALAGEITLLTQTQLRPLLEKAGSSLDALSGSLENAAPAIVRDTQSLMQRLNQGASSLNQLLGERNRDNVAQLLQQGASTAENAKRLSAELLLSNNELKSALSTLDKTMSTAGPDAQASLEDLRATMATLAMRVDAVTYNLESASRHFDEFGREIRKHPNRLLFNPIEDDDVKKR
jgi:phospholipid/cholesterol/gamma-HCH transport system substrate-binding protein